MISGARTNQLLGILAIALCAVGIYITDPRHWDRLILSWSSILADQPINSALIFIAASSVTYLFNQRVASTVCAIAVFGLAVMQFDRTSLSSSGDVSDAIREMPMLLTFSLAVAILNQCLPGFPKWRIALSASLYFVTICASITFFIGIAILSIHNPASRLAILQALGCLGLSAIWLQRLLIKWPAKRTDFLRYAAPAAVTAGTFNAAIISWLISRHDASSIPQRLTWTIVTVIISVWLIASVYYALAANRKVLELTNANLHQKKLLRRQRQIMHRRANALRQSRTRYADLFRRVPVPLVLTNAAGHVLEANPAMVDLLGVQSEDFLRNQNFSAFYANPADRDKLLSECSKAPGDIHQGELQMRRADGELRTVLYVLRIIRAADRTIEVIQGTINDITEVRRVEAEQKQLESKLRLSQKLESVGRLASGIAHEINTPMQYIGDNLYFLKQSFDSLGQLLATERRLLSQYAEFSVDKLAQAFLQAEEELEIEDTLLAVPGALDRAQEGVAAVSHIVSAMKELAHPGQGGMTSVDVNHLIETALTVSRHTYKTVAQIETNLASVPNVLAFKNELCQVFINLIVNAAHAIETAKESGTRHGVIRIQTALEGNHHVCISIEDNGCGIPRTAMEKIFDPFFTTKDVGVGTGQGLSIARTTIVEKHGGDLDVESTVGSGTTFTIKLPTNVSATSADTILKEPE